MDRKNVLRINLCDKQNIKSADAFGLCKLNKSEIKRRFLLVKDDIEWCLHHSESYDDFVHKMKFFACNVVRETFGVPYVFTNGFSQAIPLTSFQKDWDLQYIYELFKNNKNYHYLIDSVPFILTRYNSMEKIKNDFNEIDFPINQYLYIIDEFKKLNILSNDRIINQNIKFDTYKMFPKLASYTPAKEFGINNVDELFQKIKMLQNEITQIKQRIAKQKRIISKENSDEKIILHKNEILVLTKQKLDLQKEIKNLRNISYLRDYSMILIGQEINLEADLFYPKSVEKVVESMLPLSKGKSLTK